MNLKAGPLATAAAGLLLLVTACGGGSAGDSSGNSAGNGGSASNSADGAGNGGSGSSGSSIETPPLLPPAPTSSSGSTDNTSCQRLTETTFIGGNLFVAEQGPIGVTLLSDGDGLIQHRFDGDLWVPPEFSILFDSVFGVSVSNRQDMWYTARPFPAGTPVGTSTQVQVPPPTYYGPVPITFPKGIPIELWLHGPIARERTSSSTASIHKDILGGDRWATASVTYGPNNTATVTFFATTEGPYYSVGLTNVVGTGCASGA